MSAIVLDASVTMTWFFADEKDAAADAVLHRLVRGDDTAAVPGIWPLEVTNVLLLGERRGRCSLAEAARFLVRLEALPIEVDAHTALRATREVLSLARAHALSVYDATYLELASRGGHALATRDATLADAARALGLEVLGCPARAP
jgi:predicted nucleic acid-binding protein